MLHSRNLSPKTLQAVQDLSAQNLSGLLLELVQETQIIISLLAESPQANDRFSGNNIIKPNVSSLNYKRNLKSLQNQPGINSDLDHI
jgi:hypothetical protein